MIRRLLTAVGQFLLISDGAHAEIRKIGQLGSMTLAVPAYANYPAGATVESVELHRRRRERFRANRRRGSGCIGA